MCPTVPRCSFFISAMILAVAGVAAAASITIDGKEYKNVEIERIGNRYYVEVPGRGDVLSVPVADIPPGDIQWYDEVIEPLPVPGGEPVYAGASRVFVSEVTEAGDRLEINALVLRAADTTVAFCAVDTGALNRVLVEAVVERLAADDSSIARDNLMISATHTHTGAFSGLMSGVVQELAFGTFSRDMLDKATEHVSEALREAKQALEPARLKIAEAQAPDYHYNRSKRGAPLDDTLSVLYAETLESRPIAYLVNYAAHPTVLFDKKIGRGRDFPGGLADALRRKCGADIPVLFINGAEGDAAPKPPAGPTPVDKARAMGKALAQETYTLVQSARPALEAKVSYSSREVALPMSILGNLAPDEVLLHAFRINDSLFLSMPGEACGKIGLALREKATGHGARHVFLCGLTNGYTGYHTDAAGFFSASYESQMSFFGPLMLQWYLENHPVSAEQPGDSKQDGNDGHDYGETSKRYYSPLLKNNIESYHNGVRYGIKRKEEIRDKWNTARQQLSMLLDMVGGMSDELPPEASELLAKLPREDAAVVGLQFAAYYVREQFKDLSEPERARLIGCAEGAQLPFDIILLMQFLVDPRGIPEQYAQIITGLQLGGIDFLS